MSDIGIKKISWEGLGDAAAVFDFGCGTGTLAVLVKQEHPRAQVSGLDVDEAVIRTARRKLTARGLDVHLDRYEGGRFPYADGSFDRVLTSFVFHHLDDRKKRAVLREIKRVLRPSGAALPCRFRPVQKPVPETHLQ